ncbi:hypothetical protein [Brenneria uluponensis]|uniref:hypothetical protein n=1 Tax=Brenneria uluponensis TaxID=3057057 RepID=UPI0028E43EB9|nr:hypothetical protein [Brenneria ulupoensis]
MPAIDITSMRGEMPRSVEHMLPDGAAVSAQNCNFRRGVITPMREDEDQLKSFAVKPKTIFHYRDDFWFAWNKTVYAIRSPVANDAYTRVYYTDGEFPKVTSAPMATAGQGNYPAAYFRLGVPVPANPIVIGVITPPDGVTDSSATDDETRYYTETYVTAYGEEGPPGPASSELTITYTGSSVELKLQPPGQQNHNITQRRIYRSATSSEAADFLLVAELDIAVETFIDNITDSQLSATLETYDYFMPPDGMSGLCMMSNGIAAGFMGNQVMFSEAYLPYAWKDSNKQTTQHEIVSIAAIGTTLVVGTTAQPYIFSGITPSNITGDHPQSSLSCVSAASMVAMDGFVLYASPNGLVSIGADGSAAIATASIIEARQWRKSFNPTTIRAWRLENEYVALFDDELGVSGFIFDPVNMDIRYFTSAWDAAFNEEKSDQLYIVKGQQLFTFGTAETPVNFQWKSKLFLAPQSTAFSCLRLMGSDLAAIGVIIYVDGRAILQLPPGSIRSSNTKISPVRGSRWQVAIYGSAQVDRLTLSTSLQEMPA